MSAPVRVLGVPGSLRKGSFNRGLLRAASEMLPEGMTLDVYELGALPLYDGDVEAAGLPEPVQDFQRRIEAADALLFATPEYNYSMAGVLKNAIDWGSRPSPARAT
jgi:chromate reductase